MVNSSATRLFKGFCMKQKTYLCFYCRGTVNAIESKAVNNDQFEKKMKIDMKTCEDSIGTRNRTEADEKDTEIQAMLRTARERRLKLQEELIIPFEKILQTETMLRTDGERRKEIEEEMIFHFQKILQNESVSHTIQGKRLKVHIELFQVERELQDKKDILYKTSNEEERKSLTNQVNELLQKQKELQEVLVLYIQTEREQQTALDSIENIIKDYRRKNVKMNICQILIPCSIIAGILVFMVWI